LHIVQRGHNRQRCFFAEDDYLSYLHWLGEALTATQSALHAYVLMTNHVHLLLTVREAKAVPTLMISLGRRYVEYINRGYRRTGTLWDSRYKSSLIQAARSRNDRGCTAICSGARSMPRRLPISGGR
jgi:putative transposase